MLFHDYLLEATEIFEQMFMYDIRSWRIAVCEENMGLIKELQGAMRMWHPDSMSWTVIGEVKSELAYFVMHLRRGDPVPGGGQVIKVNFRQRKVTRRAA